MSKQSIYNMLASKAEPIKIDLSVIDDLNAAIASIRPLESNYDVIIRNTNSFLKEARGLIGSYELVTTQAAKALNGYQNVLSQLTKVQRQYVAQAKELGIDAKKTPEYNKAQQQSFMLEVRIEFLKNKLENELKSAVPKL
jgi:hypothetical protein